MDNLYYYYSSVPVIIIEKRDKSINKFKIEAAYIKGKYLLPHENNRAYQFFLISVDSVTKNEILDYIRKTEYCYSPTRFLFITEHISQDSLDRIRKEIADNIEIVVKIDGINSDFYKKGNQFLEW